MRRNTCCLEVAMCVTCLVCFSSTWMEFNVFRVECALKASARHRGILIGTRFQPCICAFCLLGFKREPYGLWTKVAQFLARPKKAPSSSIPTPIHLVLPLLFPRTPHNEWTGRDCFRPSHSSTYYILFPFCPAKKCRVTFQPLSSPAQLGKKERKVSFGLGEENGEGGKWPS